MTSHVKVGFLTPMRVFAGVAWTALYVSTVVSFSLAPTGVLNFRNKGSSPTSRGHQDKRVVFKHQAVTDNDDEAGQESKKKKRVVVIGNGPVGQRVVELCVDGAERMGMSEEIEVTSFCEERLAAYNRVQLTKWFETRDAESLSLVGEYDESGNGAYYKETKQASVRVGERAEKLDLARKVVRGASGIELPYDAAVLATGSKPFVPPIPGANDLEGVFVYRTIDDLENLVKYVESTDAKKAAVLGGGLLGLEAAKAVHDLGLETQILEYAPILLSRQIDRKGHDRLVGKIEALGLEVKCDARVKAFVGGDGVETPSDRVKAVQFNNDSWDDAPVDLVVISAGIRPRDDVARDSGIECHDRGGIIVGDDLRTSDPRVFAVGECALHDGRIYGLVAPGFQQADVAADHILASLSSSDDNTKSCDSSFSGADLSTKLKLLGCDVANFGVNAEPDDAHFSAVWDDPIAGVYRKLIVSPSNVLVGGVLVGDAGDYGELYAKFASKEPLAESLASLLAPPSAVRESAGTTGSEEEVSSEAPLSKQICSCNDVSRGAIISAIEDLGESATYADVKKCTKAGSGCGGCEPDVKKILAFELEKMGKKVTNHICEHFAFSRPELMALVASHDYASFEQVLSAHGTSNDGCEVCKPAVASMLASLRNEIILADGRDSLQDTNDRSLANMQRGGSYSVVPRVPGGEIKPDALIAIGNVAKDFNLYTKITGAQRIDLFGASKADLPDIWARLGEAGLESGHAYGKALRTVKSCVGSSWCRYGVQNSVDFAVTIENRYKGLRAPHKLKSAVSGCVRECAEAQCKDFGMIATENGYDLYLCGNGGANPRHGVLFASGVDEQTVIQYLDRFLMYYCLTGERLERTARWFERLGPNDDMRLEALQDVVIHDKLGINAELEARMQKVVDTYHDEWAVVVNDPKLRARFKQFANTDETQDPDETIEFIDVRGQRRPVDWPADGEPQTNWRPPLALADDDDDDDDSSPNEKDDVFARSAKSWVPFGPAVDFPVGIGTPILYGETQLAVFRTKHGDWFATQNMCPHKQAFVLAQGLVGLAGDTDKVACPLHKKQFGLADGKQLDGDLRILTFPIRVSDDGQVEIELAAREEVDAVLGTSKLRVTCAGASSSSASGGPALTPVTLPNNATVFAR